MATTTTTTTTKITSRFIRHKRRKQGGAERFLFCTAVLLAISGLSSIPSAHGFLSSKPVVTKELTPVASPHRWTNAAVVGRRSLSETTATTSSTTTSLNYEKVFVAGGSRGVGHAIIEKLSETGTTKVVALVRREESANELNAMEGVEAVLGDAFDQKAVENAMDGCDVAITTLGGTAKDRRIDYEGNNNVIESAGILGVQRIILVTSIGCGSSREAAPPNVFEILKDVLAAKEKAENILMDFYTNSNWSIVRPGGLVSEPATGEAVLTEDATAIGSIHREDVADLVLKVMDSPKTERKVLSAVDPSIASAVAVEGKIVPVFEL